MARTRLASARGLAFLAGALLLALASPVSVAQPFDYARDPNPQFVIDSPRASRSPGHTLSFSMSRGELETYRVRVTYPGGFRFNGFDALGPMNTPVGTLELDVNRDGRPDLTMALRSLSPDTAYADVIADGRFTPGLEPLLAHRGRGEFLLRLPFGGDANPATLVVPFDGRVTLTLFAGLLTNPDRGGTHTIAAELVSVDPDTDGADDGAGAPPLTAAFEVTVAIEHVSFARFCIDRADLKRRGIRHHERDEDDGEDTDLSVRDRFRIHGRFALGAGSDGVELAHEWVTVAFGGLALRIPGRLLSSTANAVVFSDPLPGIRKLELRADGGFEVDVRGLDLNRIALDQAVAFSLQIGDDRGEASIRFDRTGHYRPRGAGKRCAP